MNNVERHAAIVNPIRIALAAAGNANAGEAAEEFMFALCLLIEDISSRRKRARKDDAAPAEPTEEEIERVARAIHDKRLELAEAGVSCPTWSWSGDNLTPWALDYFRSLARAAIAAMPALVKGVQP